MDGEQDVSELFTRYASCLLLLAVTNSCSLGWGENSWRLPKLWLLLLLLLLLPRVAVSCEILLNKIEQRICILVLDGHVNQNGRPKCLRYIAGIQNSATKAVQLEVGIDFQN